MRVLCQGVRQRCADTSRRLQELEQAQAGGGPGGGGASGRALFARRSRGHGGSGSGGLPSVLRPAWLGHPALVGGCMLLAVLADPASPAGRLVGAVPLLALLPSS